MPRTASDISARIVAAARARFLGEGVDGASLRAIARDARTSIGMIYYYFPTKDDLFLAVVEEVYLGLLRDLEARLAPTRPVVERLRALYARIGALTDDEWKVLRLVLREALTSPARLSRLIRRFQRGHLPLLIELVRDGVAAGLFRADVSPWLLFAAVIAVGGPGQAILAVVDAHLAPSGAPSRAARPDALVDLLLSGLSGSETGGRRRRRQRGAVQAHSGSAAASASTSARELEPPPRNSR